jgi:hypothetical protein
MSSLNSDAIANKQANKQTNNAITTAELEDVKTEKKWRCVGE